MTTASASLDNIVIMTIKTTISYCLITRQGASFDVELVRRTSSASLGNIIVTSKVLQTGGTVMSMLVGARILLNTPTLLHTATGGGRSKKNHHHNRSQHDNMTTTNYLSAKRPVGPNTPAV
jgi:hypothetical protein